MDDLPPATTSPAASLAWIEPLSPLLPPPTGERMPADLDSHLPVTNDSRQSESSPGIAMAVRLVTTTAGPGYHSSLSQSSPPFHQIPYPLL